MPEIALADYERADRELDIGDARSGFTAHAIVYVMVMAALIVLNLTIMTGFLWFVFPLVGWGIALAAHYLFGVRRAGKAIA
jgi:2TM domain